MILTLFFLFVTFLAAQAQQCPDTCCCVFAEGEPCMEGTIQESCEAQNYTCASDEGDVSPGVPDLEDARCCCTWSPERPCLPGFKVEKCLEHDYTCEGGEPVLGSSDNCGECSWKACIRLDTDSVSYSDPYTGTSSATFKFYVGNSLRCTTTSRVPSGTSGYCVACALSSGSPADVTKVRVEAGNSNAMWIDRVWVTKPFLFTYVTHYAIGGNNNAGWCLSTDAQDSFSGKTHSTPCRLWVDFTPSGSSLAPPPTRAPTRAPTTAAPTVPAPTNLQDVPTLSSFSCTSDSQCPRENVWSMSSLPRPCLCPLTTRAKYSSRYFAGLGDVPTTCNDADKRCGCTLDSHCPGTQKCDRGHCFYDQIPGSICRTTRAVDNSPAFNPARTFEECPRHYFCTDGNYGYDSYGTCIKRLWNGEECRGVFGGSRVCMSDQCIKENEEWSCRNLNPKETAAMGFVNDYDNFDRNAPCDQCCERRGVNCHARLQGSCNSIGFKCYTVATLCVICKDAVRDRVYSTNVYEEQCEAGFNVETRYFPTCHRLEGLTAH